MIQGFSHEKDTLPGLANNYVGADLTQPAARFDGLSIRSCRATMSGMDTLFLVSQVLVFLFFSGHVD